MDHAKVQEWLERYVEAWQTYDRDTIRGLFADDATYAFHPWDDPLEGADAIIDNWLESPDEAGSWEADYRPLMVVGNRAVTTGTTRYANGRAYWNLWEVDFDDEGRCTRFVEWFMPAPKKSES
jgi:hypothetical protein